MIQWNEYFVNFPKQNSPTALEFLNEFSRIVNGIYSINDLFKRGDITNTVVMFSLARFIYDLAVFCSYYPNVVFYSSSIPLALAFGEASKFVQRITAFMQEQGSQALVPQELLEEVVTWVGTFVNFIWQQFRAYGGTDEDLILPNKGE